MQAARTSLALLAAIAAVTGLESFGRADALPYELAKFQPISTRNDHYLALAHVVRERLLHHWVHSARTYLEGQHRTVAFLSAE